MIGETPYINMLSSPLQSPPTRDLGDKRQLDSVFTSPRNPLRNPDDIRFRNTIVPTVPGAPVTMGMLQVVYDDQPIWHRGATDAGPVRRFFRRWINDQNQMRQP